MTALWLIGWAIGGILAGLAIIMPIALWVWAPPELLSLAWGGLSVMGGWVAGAWWEDRP
jgi:hypothetical protein